MAASARDGADGARAPARDGADGANTPVPTVRARADTVENGWPANARRARLHIVTGKGGTGKTTVAAALAIALAAGGRRVLLVEVEERQSIARLFDLPPLPYEERRVAVASEGGEVRALAVDVEAALMEYFAMFYNLGFAGRTLRRMGAVEFATTLAPGLRDVLLTGKTKECVTRKDKDGGYAYDAVVMDAPPTGRVVSFLNVTVAMANLARRGPIRNQADGVAALLHSEDAAVHVVTQLQDMPVAETVEAIAQLREARIPIGAVVVNAVAQPLLSAAALDRATGGGLDRADLGESMRAAGLDADRAQLDGFAAEAALHAEGIAAERECADVIEAQGLPVLRLPYLVDGADIGGVYDLVDQLRRQGVA